MSSNTEEVSSFDPAYYKVTSEWMETHIQNVPEAALFGCADMLCGPVVLFTDKVTGHLFIMRPGSKDGMLDLSTALGIAQLRVTAFDMSLSQNGGGLHVALIASNAEDIPGSQELIVTRVVSEDNIYDGSVWAASALREVSSNQPSRFSKTRLSAVKLGASASISATGGSDIPGTIVEVKVAETAAGNATTAIARLVVPADVEAFSVEWIQLPNRPDENTTIYSCPGRLPSGSGTFFAYLVGKARYCTFVNDTPDPYGYQVFPNVQAQDKITSMKPLLRSDGLTDLLIAGQSGLYRHTAESFSTLGSRGTKILNGQVAHVHPASTAVATRADIWAVINDQELGYLTVESTKLAGPIQAGQWTAVRQGPYRRFRPSVTADRQLRRVCIATDDGSLQLIERSTAGVWTEKQVAISPVESLETRPAYVTHLRFFGRRAARKLVRLMAKGSATCLVNHKAVVIDKNGIDVEADSNGMVEIINETTTFTTPQLFFQEYNTVSYTDPQAPDTVVWRTDRSQTGPPTLIDVSLGVRKRLQDLPTDADDLQKLTCADLQTGQSQKVFDNDPSVDFQALAKNLQSLKDLTSELPHDGTSKPVDSHPEHATFAWDVLHFVETIKQGAESFFIDAGHLIVKIAGEIKAFAISCLEHALKAFSTLLQHAGATWKRLMSVLGWVFNWADIKLMKDNLAMIFTYQIDSAKEHVDAWFVQLDQALAHQVAQASETPQPLTSNQQKKLDELHGDARDQQEADASLTTCGESGVKQNHPASDYILSRLSFLVSGDSMLQNIDPALAAAAEVVKIFSSSKMASIMQGAGDLLVSIQDTIRKIANTELHSLGDLLHALATSPIWVQALTLLRTLVSEVLRPAMDSLFEGLLAATTSPIQVPFFSALYKHATGHDTPSLLDLLTFIIAVPATVLYKLATGSKAQPIAAWTRADLQDLAQQSDNVKRNETQYYVWTVNESSAFKLVNAIQPFVVAVNDLVGNVFDTAKALDLTDSIGKMFWFRLPLAVLRFSSIGFNFPLITRDDLTQTKVVLWREYAWLLDSLGSMVDVLGAFSLEFGELVGDISTVALGIVAFTLAQGWFAIVDAIEDVPADWDDKSKQRSRAMEGLRFPEIVSVTVSRCCFVTAQRIKMPISPPRIAAREGLATAGSVCADLAIACAITKGALLSSLPPGYGNSRTL